MHLPARQTRSPHRTARSRPLDQLTMVLHVRNFARESSLLVALAAFVTCCRTTSAEIIPNSQVLFGNSSSTDYAATIYQTPVGDPTAVLLNYTGTTLDVTGVTLDEGSDWYLTNSGDEFTAATIAANQFPVIASANSLHPPVPIPLGTFYLGMTTGVGFTNGQPNRDVFGWIELNNTGTELLPVANAVAYNEPGIIIGTTTPAPEPATLAILAPLALLLARRSKTTPPHRRELS